MWPGPLKQWSFFFIYRAFAVQKGLPPFGLDEHIGVKLFIHRPDFADFQEDHTNVDNHLYANENSLIKIYDKYRTQNNEKGSVYVNC